MNRKTRTSRLKVAIKQGRLADVVLMLEAGASVHDFGNGFARPIAVATAHGHIDIIKALIARGADTEATCRRNMDGAWKGNPEWPYRNGFTALHIAAEVGNAEALLVLLQLGAHPNSTDSTGATPMMVAACQPGYGTSTQLAILHSLLEAGAEPALENEGGGLAIHFAAAQCDTQVVELLLSKAPSTLNHADEEGSTPLAIAAKHGRESMMSLLLSSGASDFFVWATKGVSALDMAVVHGKESSVRFLLKHGLEAVGGFPAITQIMRNSVQHGRGDFLEILLNVEGEEKQEVWANRFVYCAPNSTIFHGNSPEARAAVETVLGCPILHVAAKYCSIPAVHILLSAGAVAEKVDSRGKLAVDEIGSILPEDERNIGREEAVRRMLLKGPAFRARSWTWPVPMEFAPGRASKVPPSPSTPLPNMYVRAQTRRPTDEALFIKNFDRYVRKADLSFAGDLS